GEPHFKHRESQSTPDLPGVPSDPNCQTGPDCRALTSQAL
ncbi:hypothetical protein AK812_SmicGene48480, partial [Symbiodinium microadriaticum]